MSQDRTGKDNPEEQDEDCEVENIVRELSLLEVLAQGPEEVIEEPKHQEQQQAIVRVEYQGPICEDGTRNWVTSYPDDCREEPENDRQAIILRYKKDKSERRKKPLYLYSISVHNTELKSLIQDAFDGYPGFAEELASGKFTYDFEQFVHRWYRFGVKLTSLQNTTLGTQLEVLYAALKEEIGKTVEEFRELLRQRLITYGLLSTLFAPGEIIVNSSGGLQNLLRVLSTHYSCGDDPHFNIRAQYIDYDGARYGLEDSWLRINPFKGSEAIEGLEYIPLTLFETRESFVLQLVDRGRRAIELNQAGYMMHAGFAHLGGSRSHVYIEGRIQIDPDGSSKYNNTVYLHRMPDDLGPENPEQFSTTQLMLITSKIRGFDFTNKEWGTFEVDNIAEIAWNENAFDRLVVSSARKRLVKALVDGNESHKGSLDDIIQGKGQGLVILLSGLPGTGKTLTAEAIAEHLRIPLYSATAGELDVGSASRLEAALEKKLQLAARWGAVLLLDEADAFLEARKDGDTERNQRVAVFLRLLEYYKGVLIMTTNRQVTFDQAFHSRIHLTMHYDALDQHARAQVWKTFLSKSNLATSDYERLGQLDLNGRRIKHMVKMAQLLAQSEGSELQMEHINDVLDVAMRGEHSFANV
ncbi:hypothetical protein CKM354_000777800 [Cercospora kikuchii]|uniref:AAA+ ATPase domain-containing protein n=1 Tax=Cercospora kikuchii TaxID=84275 RepID=A0A9P3CKN4_9PEZI|nr:uncharacterized protein CKM354_000777800 [Cercospora kikuchii]GIZ44584.1 hypothetical protein CKM354_000777800 [Cercospora kikuchii]